MPGSSSAVLICRSELELQPGLYQLCFCIASQTPDEHCVPRASSSALYRSSNATFRVVREAAEEQVEEPELDLWRVILISGAIGACCVGVGAPFAYKKYRARMFLDREAKKKFLGTSSDWAYENQTDNAPEPEQIGSLASPVSKERPL